MDIHLTGIILVSSGLAILVLVCIIFLKKAGNFANKKPLLYPLIVGSICFIAGMTVIIATTEKPYFLPPYGLSKTTENQ